MSSLFPPLTAATHHLCLLLPFSLIYPPLLPYLLGASLSHTLPTPLSALNLLLLSLLLDGHALATTLPDSALLTRLPPIHLDPHRLSGLLQLSALAILPALILHLRRRPYLIAPADAALAAALLALLSLVSAHFLSPALVPSALPPSAPASPFSDGLLHLLTDFLSLRTSPYRATALFDLRRALRELVSIPAPLLLDAAAVQRAVTAAVFALLGAVDESIQFQAASLFDAVTAAAGIAAAGWMFVAVVEGEGVGSRLLAAAAMMFAVRVARYVSSVKVWLDLLRPFAVIGANWLWVLLAMEFRVVEMLMDAVRVNAKSSMLTVTKGVCEVLAAGEGELAEGFFAVAKVAVVMAVALTWEGWLDLGWASAGTGHRLGDRWFGAE